MSVERSWERGGRRSREEDHLLLGPFGALIFDQDGTLLDAEALHCASWVRVAAEVGVVFDEGVFASFAGRGDLAIGEHFVVLGAGPAAAQLVDRKRACYREQLDALELMPGARRFLERGEAAGLPMAMATISPEAETLRVVRRHDLDRFFAAIVHRESSVPGRPGAVVRSKPAPDIYLAAAALLGVEPGRCCTFEDSPTGVMAARAAGMSVVAIPTRFSGHFDFSTADAVVQGFDDLDVEPPGVVAVHDRGDAP